MRVYVYRRRIMYIEEEIEVQLHMDKKLRRGGGSNPVPLLNIRPRQRSQWSYEATLWNFITDNN